MRPSPAFGACIAERNATAISGARFRSGATPAGGLPVRRWPIKPLAQRAFRLRSTHTVADAVYVALAEGLVSALVTCDVVNKIVYIAVYSFHVARE